MKTFGITLIGQVKRILAVGFVSALGSASLFAQVYTGTLADLAANGGTLTVGDKTFSGFKYQQENLTSFDASQIVVTASESEGIYYLTWSGNISLVSSGVASADILLNYVVTANQGSVINMIDQAYTGSAQNGYLAIDETAAVGAFGGTVVGYSHLQTGDYSDPPPEPLQGDMLNINPAQAMLYVSTDIALGVSSEDGGFITTSQLGQSFHQTVVPEPNVMLLGGLGGGLLLLLGLRRQVKR